MILQLMILALEFWGLIFAIFMGIYIVKMRDFRKRSNKVFLVSVVVQAIILIADITGVLCQGQPSFVHRGIIITAYILQYALGFSQMVLFANFVKAYLEEEIEVSSVYVKLCSILATIGILLLLISQVHHNLFYWIDAQNYYRHGALYPLTFIIGISGMAINAVFVYRYRKYIDFYYKLSLVTYMLLPTIAMIGQAFVTSISFLQVANTLVMIMLLFFVLMEAVDKERALAKKYVKQKLELSEQKTVLTETRMDLLRSQIRPHFIYNTLGTIEKLCLTQPQKAAEITRNFSKYLRGNFDELESQIPIRVSREIEHVKHYTDIEQVRFTDIRVIYDIRCQDFYIPALSIQPLVENAIKHGLMRLEYGGTVTIATFETDLYYCVCVTDDGVGFNPNELKPKNTGKHLGIDNIRERIQIMCQGRLEIISEPGKGTRAVIYIPKERYK